MRIWDVSVSKLCRKHLLGEHRELHALYSILLYDKKGYRQHPETLRWEGKLPALKKRHQLLVSEMEKRGYKHNSPLLDSPGMNSQSKLLQSLEEQEKLLNQKNCECLL